MKELFLVQERSSLETNNEEAQKNDHLFEAFVGKESENKNFDDLDDSYQSEQSISFQLI